MEKITFEEKPINVLGKVDINKTLCSDAEQDRSTSANERVLREEQITHGKNGDTEKPFVYERQRLVELWIDSDLRLR